MILEMMFNLMKENNNILGVAFLDHTFLYTAYADDTTFFLKGKESVEDVIDIFDNLDNLLLFKT